MKTSHHFTHSHISRDVLAQSAQFITGNDALSCDSLVDYNDYSFDWRTVKPNHHDDEVERPIELVVNLVISSSLQYLWRRLSMHCLLHLK